MTSQTPNRPTDPRAQFHAQLAVLRQLDEEQFSRLDPASLRPILVPIRVIPSTECHDEA